MNAQENKEFIRKYIEAISGKPKPSELVDLYVAEQPLIEHIAMNEAAFPEYEMHIEKLIAEDDLVSVIGRAGGTHKGPFMGMPPTGKSWDVPIHITYRIQGGKIVEHWMVIDTAAFMQQLGMIPSAADSTS
ncbi:MAG TPA: ester cyclase [Anaerolineales bacterium]|nr:ester cyclase [Anaerolineales bacterium]